MVNVKEPNQLAQLSFKLHDWRLDFDTYHFDATNRRVQIEAYSEVSKQAQHCLLVFDNIVSARVEDREGIGVYCIEEITFDSAASKIRIACVEPAIFELVTNGLSINLLERS